MLKFDRSHARKLLPRRSRGSNKTDGGRSLIIAGSSGFYGAAVLSATAAARVGSGYTQILTHLGRFSFQKSPDFLTADISKTKIDNLEFNAVGVGPGLGTGSETLKIIKKLIALNCQNVVLDADALTVIARKKLYPLPKSWILTPHAGEMSRLLKVPSEKIKTNPLKYLKKAQQKYDCVVLLKGPETSVFDGQKVIHIQSGNSALAKAGTGDVLTGMIVGFLAQNLVPMDAAGLGAFTHGFIADEWIRTQKDHLSLLASDLLTGIPSALFKIRQRTK